MTERQFVYLSLQRGGTTIDSAEQYFQGAKVTNCVYMRMPGVGEGKDTDLGFCQDGSRTNKRGEAERDRCPR